MRFYPADAPVPATLATAEFRLEPLHPRHVALDYDALMSSRERLNIWSGGRWPRAGFTLDENLADLERHDREHRDREAFTYTVLAPDGARCLGCVYIEPLASILDWHAVPAERRPAVIDDDAAVSFWARADAAGAGLEARLAGTLADWFPREWAFARVSFMARERFTEQRLALEAAGLRAVWTFADTPQPADAFGLYRA